MATSDGWEIAASGAVAASPGDCGEERARGLGDAPGGEAGLCGAFAAGNVAITVGGVAGGKGSARLGGLRTKLCEDFIDYAAAAA